MPIGDFKTPGLKKEKSTQLFWVVSCILSLHTICPTYFVEQSSNADDPDLNTITSVTYF